MKQTLFSISEDILALDALLDDLGGDVTDEEVEAAIDQWLEENADNLKDKLDGYGFYINEQMAHATACKDEASRLRERAQVFERRAGRLKDRLQFFFQRHAWQKQEGTHFTFSLRKAGGKRRLTLLAEPEALPPQFRITETIVRPDQDGIRHAMDEAGTDEIEGVARLEPRSEYLKIS